MKQLCFILIFFHLSLVFSACPNGSYEGRDSCFFFEENVTGFALATSHCLSVGGELTSIHDGFTNVYIAEQAQAIFHESTVTNFWIGLTNLIPSKQWTWVDNSTFDFHNWASGEPQNMTGNNCAALSLSTGLWNAEDCSKSKPYVCRSDKNAYETTTTQTIPTTTTSRPPVTPDQTCVYMNIYLNYFFDAGQLTNELFSLYFNITTYTASHSGIGGRTRLLSIYMANANGSAPPAVPFAEVNVGNLIDVINAPWYTSVNSSITADLTYYGSVLTQQLQYSTTPVIVMLALGEKNNGKKNNGKKDKNKKQW